MVLFRGHLLCFGVGYAAKRLCQGLLAEGWVVTGTARTADKVAKLEAMGLTALPYSGETPLPKSAFAGVTHVLVSTPPLETGEDPVLHHHAQDLVDLNPEWVGYFSTTGVYGDTGGQWIDEGKPVHPTQDRSKRRAKVEEDWLALWREADLPVHILRLAGIYGPGRSAFDQLRAGTAKRVVKPGQQFSRIHVDDIGLVTRASMADPDAGAIYNVCDDEPVEPADVTAVAAELLGMEPPPEVPFEEAVKTMSPMARTFWADNRKVNNERLWDDLRLRLLYPTYRQGLEAILREERGDAPSGPPAYKLGGDCTGE
jgi:nucleoside-diphosphate-sugar epimerase